MAVFSIEILPPLRGNSIQNVYSSIDKLRDYQPESINITSHHSEFVYKEQADGSLRRVSILKRPGTVAIAAAIQQRYGIPAVPHIICAGFSREETEYALLDLNFLGITNIFLLRGDVNGEYPVESGRTYNVHATDLQEQVNNFNRGIGLDDIRIEGIETPFKYGMACYPEKHEEAPNIISDIRYAKMKVDNGAQYLVSQMFFDNEKFYEFVEKCRQAGITVPIIPGIKPIGSARQINLLPQKFRTEIPQNLVDELQKCTSAAQLKEVGAEWSIEQCKDLIRHGFEKIHFYTLHAEDSIQKIVKTVF